MNYKSKYTGQQVDELLSRIEEGDLDMTVDTELSPTSDNAIANSAVVQGLAGLAEGVSEAIGNVSEQLGAEIETKANKDDYYPDMSVGMADNLVGRGDVQDAQINFRPSAGADNITDGAARIEKIKGNSVVWNQLLAYEEVKNMNDSDLSVGCWFVRQGKNNAILSGKSLTINFVSTISSSPNMSQRVNFVTGYKYLFYIKYKLNGEPASYGVSFRISSAPIQTGANSTTIHNFYDLEGESSFIYTADRNVPYVFINPTNATNDIGQYLTVECTIINLTQMFGAGNEPTSYEEYLQRKPMNIEDEYAHNEGELIDMKVDSLVSVSDNAYDYTKGYARVMGGYKYDITANEGATIVVSFYADGEDSNEEREIAPDSEGKYTFPANGICYVNGDFASQSDVCVCLNHSYDKPHPAYQQEVKDLSFIGEAFPEGMRSAGSAFDEIRFNSTKKVWEKIVRVGVRAYAEGDAEDSSVTTDGKTTNYPLDNPTPATIDLSPNFNLDYLVWDFGTEEAIVPNNVPSAPFRADINYEPNAVDDLRWAVSEIRSLKAQIAQMQTSVTNLTE